MFQNISCVIGPLIGISIYQPGSGNAFGLAALCLLLSFIIALFFIKNHHCQTHAHKANISLFQSLSVLTDRNLLFWIVSSICILIAYGVFESLMPVVIANAPEVRPTFGILVSLNALSVIVFQLIYLRFFKHMPIKRSIHIGFILIILGFALFSLNWFPFIMTLIATVIFSAGETLLFPCIETIMGKIASNRKKAIYFASGELRQIGFFIGPIMGGIILEYAGSVSLFLMCTVILIAGMISFKQIKSC